MGQAADYGCPECGYRAEFVVEDFSCGFSGDVLTPVVCTEHGIISADTGVNVRDGEFPARPNQAFPCPECRAISPRWDRRFCPKCGSDRIQIESESRGIDHRALTSARELGAAALAAV